MKEVERKTYELIAEEIDTGNTQRPYGQKLLVMLKEMEKELRLYT